MSLFQPEIFFHYLFSVDYLAAAGTTLWISLAAMAVGLIVGIVLALGRESGARPVGAIATAYIWLFRGTPVLLQIVFAFNVLPAFGLVLPGYACAVLALGLNEAAYLAEIFRSGIQAVGKGQREAADALGLREWQTMRLVILPQAIRIVIPPVGNQFISMLKLSALVSVIGVHELLLVAEQGASSNFRYLEALAAAGIYYLALTTIFMAIQARIEKAFAEETQRTAPKLAPAGAISG